MDVFGKIPWSLRLVFHVILALVNGSSLCLWRVSKYKNRFLYVCCVRERQGFSNLWIRHVKGSPPQRYSSCSYLRRNLSDVIQVSRLPWTFLTFGRYCHHQRLMIGIHGGISSFDEVPIMFKGQIYGKQFSIKS